MLVEILNERIWNKKLKEYREQIKNYEELLEGKDAYEERR